MTLTEEPLVVWAGGAADEPPGLLLPWAYGSLEGVMTV